jgi:hypothetical protein
MYANTACNGRNELGYHSGMTIVQAKAWCQDNAACVSFERLGGSHLGSFHFSTTCTHSVSIPYTDIDLYVIDRTTAAPTMCSNGGPMGSGQAAKGTPCVFPFTSMGITYTECEGVGYGGGRLVLDDRQL